MTGFGEEKKNGKTRIGRSDTFPLTFMKDKASVSALVLTTPQGGHAGPKALAFFLPFDQGKTLSLLAGRGRNTRPKGK
jgi:hypothetical protein